MTGQWSTGSGYGNKYRRSKDRDYDLVASDIKAVVRCGCRAARVKVIIETGLLTEQEKSRPAFWLKCRSRFC